MTKRITPPYRIETDRFVIRCYDLGDAPLLKKAVDESKDDLLPWLPWAKYEPQTLDEKLELLRGFRSRFDRDVDYIYAVFNADESRLLGGTGLHTRRGPDAFEIGYWTCTSEMQKGIATEVSIVLTIIGLEICKRDRIEIRCDVKNGISSKIPKNLGFNLEATRKRIDRSAEGAFLDTQIWTLFAEDFDNWEHRSFSFSAYDGMKRKIIQS